MNPYDVQQLMAYRFDYYGPQYPTGMRVGILQATTTKEEPEMSVSSKIKELSKNSDDKLLAKYGVTNDCGDLTGEGKQVVWDMLFEEKKEAIVAKLKELEAAEKKAAK